MRTPQQQLNEMLKGNRDGTPLVDLGTSTLTGVRSNASSDYQQDSVSAHPIYQTIVLDPLECIDLGSDFIRSGLLYTTPKSEYFQDDFGIEWHNDGSNIVPARNPLINASLKEISSFSKPQGLQPVQKISPEISNYNPVIAEAPSPGLLEMCFGLRSPWKFLEDIVERPAHAAALLEWSLESIISSYKYLLTNLDRQPDVIIYSDDLGYQGGMYLSPPEFRTLLLPYFQSLITHLRTLTPAAICYHSCGAIHPILPDIANLGIEILNLDTHAQGMDVIRLRKILPASLILHGSNDLCALGEAVANHDKASTAYLITELAQCAPVIAGPMDSLSSTRELLAAQTGASFIKQISDYNFQKIRRFGPVRDIIEQALGNAMDLSLRSIFT